MSTCRKCNKRKISIGDLNRRITLQGRSIKGLSDTVDFSETFTDKPVDVDAKVETVNGKTMFDGTNIERVITHNFYIRYDETVTSETWIKYKSKNFNIVATENFDERDEYLKLPAYERGPSNNPVNFA
ncbi:MAG: phage head closure protein [Gammaproteobacteria bacterium]|nr:phage head closure protein [Gammaproteobacteria bacterium]